MDILLTIVTTALFCYVWHYISVLNIHMKYEDLQIKYLLAKDTCDILRTRISFFTSVKGNYYDFPDLIRPKTKLEMAYDELGISRYSSSADIKKTYRILIKKYHPDLNKSVGASEKFRKIQESYAFIIKHDTH